jgi:ABC-2 type transport system ATP-binding protein
VADDLLRQLQQTTGNLVRVSFSEPVESEKLQGMAGVKSLTGTDAKHWTIQTDAPEVVRKSILELALAHNLNIVSLQTGSESLETVFRSLTSSSEKSNAGN